MKECSKYKITCEIDQKDFWRFYAVFDRNARTGPFTADLIEPYAHICHDMIDMDVSNLYVTKDYTRDLGMKVSLEKLKVIGL